MGVSNKKYLNLNLLVFIPEMEISELNSLYSLPHVIYIARYVKWGMAWTRIFCINKNKILFFKNKIYAME